MGSKLLSAGAGVSSGVGTCIRADCTGCTMSKMHWVGVFAVLRRLIEPEMEIGQ